MYNTEPKNAKQDSSDEEVDVDLAGVMLLQVVAQ